MGKPKGKQQSVVITSEELDAWYLNPDSLEPKRRKLIDEAVVESPPDRNDHLERMRRHKESLEILKFG